MHKELSFENRLAYVNLFLTRYIIIVVFIVIVTVIDSFIVVFLLTFALYSSIQHLLPVCFNKFSVQFSSMYTHVMKV